MVTPGLYLNRKGQRVRVHPYRSQDPRHPVVVEWLEGSMAGRTYWTFADGRYEVGTEDPLDIVSPYIPVSER